MSEEEEASPSTVPWTPRYRRQSRSPGAVERRAGRAGGGGVEQRLRDGDVGEETEQRLYKGSNAGRDAPLPLATRAVTKRLNNKQRHRWFRHSQRVGHSRMPFRMGWLHLHTSTVATPAMPHQRSRQSRPWAKSPLRVCSITACCFMNILTHDTNAGGAPTRLKK